MYIRPQSRYYSYVPGAPGHNPDPLRALNFPSSTSNLKDQALGTKSAAHLHAGPLPGMAIFDKTHEQLRVEQGPKTDAVHSRPLNLVVLEL